jgi:hypothetical protein
MTIESYIARRRGSGLRGHHRQAAHGFRGRHLLNHLWRSTSRTVPGDRGRNATSLPQGACRKARNFYFSSTPEMPPRGVVTGVNGISNGQERHEEKGNMFCRRRYSTFWEGDTGNSCWRPRRTPRLAGCSVRHLSRRRKEMSSATHVSPLSAVIHINDVFFSPVPFGLLESGHDTGNTRGNPDEK